jgi:hypothetical protein
MSRPDLTDNVIRFIKASSDGEAYDIFSSIARDRALRGGACGCLERAPKQGLH